MNRLSPWLCTLIVPSVLIWQSPCAVAASYMAEGEKLYGKHEFAKAARCFEAEVAENAESAAAHYYLANTYLQLKRTADAIKEYEQASTLDPVSSAGQFSRTALQRLQPPPEPAPAAAMPEIKTGPRTVVKSHTDESIVESEQKEARVKEIMKEAEDKIGRIKEQMQSEIDGQGRPLYSRGRNYYMPDTQSIKDQYNSQIEDIRKEAQRRADEVKRYYQQRAAARGN